MFAGILMQVSISQAMDEISNLDKKGCALSEYSQQQDENEKILDRYDQWSNKSYETLGEHEPREWHIINGYYHSLGASYERVLENRNHFIKDVGYIFLGQSLMIGAAKASVFSNIRPSYRGVGYGALWLVCSVTALGSGGKMERDLESATKGLNHYQEKLGKAFPGTYNRDISQDKADPIMDKLIDRKSYGLLALYCVCKETLNKISIPALLYFSTVPSYFLCAGLDQNGWKQGPKWLKNSVKGTFSTAISLQCGVAIYGIHQYNRLSQQHLDVIDRYADRMDAHLRRTIGEE